jgi:hypothetical protein
MLAKITSELAEVSDPVYRAWGAARRGHGKVDGGHRWSAGKRSAGSHFYPYRTRIGSHDLP